MDEIESQNIELRELRDDIKEIKDTMKELAKVASTQALQNQRLDIVEKDTSHIKDDLISIHRELVIIDKRCLERVPVIEFGKKRMDSPDKYMSNDTWWTMFIGSAVRNGIWIVLTGLIVPLILYLTGVKK